MLFECDLYPSDSQAKSSDRKWTHISSNHGLHQWSKSGDKLIPIIYNSNYDIYFFKLDVIHPFDMKKWGKIAKSLAQYLEQKFNSKDSLVSPSHAITKEELSLVHSTSFIRCMHWSPLTVAKAVEVCPLLFVPCCITQCKLLRPIKWQVSGSILGGYLSLKYGWAINLGGGFHHCSANRAEGFCLFADITLTIRYLWREVNEELNVLIVDCDAHQGNGYARDVLKMTKQQQKRVYILDMFNPNIFPGDEWAQTAIDRAVLLPHKTEDNEYLKLLKFHINATLNDDKFRPDLIIYNAGTDILIGDRLGHLRITPQGITKRDEIVFNYAKEHGFAILMLLSGGYQRNNAEVIANSIKNLLDTKLIYPFDSSETTQ